MGLVISTTAGVVLWIVLWALGWKGLDAFMMPLAIFVVGAAVKVASGYLPGRRT